MLFSMPNQLLNFSSLDALSLSTHPFVQETGIEFMIQWGIGDLPSRPIERLIHLRRETEEQFASLSLFESATLLEAGPNGLSQIIHTLSSSKTLILKQIGVPYTYPKPSLIKSFDLELHDLPDLISKIDRSQIDHIILVAESISSLTGKESDLKKLAALAKQNGFFFIVDDSNSFTARGKDGIGLAGSTSGIDLVYGSFPKTFGSYASYFLTSIKLKDYLLKQPSLAAAFNHLSPLILGFIRASISLLPHLQDQRELLSKKANSFRDLFFKNGISTISTSHMIPLSFDTTAELKQFTSHLSENQCLSHVFQLQSDGRSRCLSRLIVNAHHKTKELHKLSLTLKNFRAAPCCEALV